MAMTTWIRRAVTCALPAAFAVTLGAQQPAPLAQPDSVPYELAAAFLSLSGFPGEPQIIVGAMPEWMAQRLPMPANGRVLGSAFVGTTAEVIVQFPMGPDSAVITETKPALLARGWTDPGTPQIFTGGDFGPHPWRR